METEALISFDVDGNNSLKKAEVIEYIESLGLESNEEKACIFAYFSDARNPYGGVPNYLNFEDVSSSSYGSGYGYSGYRRSGRSRYYGRSGGSRSSGGSAPSWDEYVKDYMTSIKQTSGGVKFKEWDSPLDQAYRSRINKILNNTKA